MHQRKSRASLQQSLLPLPAAQIQVRGKPCLVQDRCYPSGVILQVSVLGVALFEIFVSDRDGRIDYILSKFANDTELLSAGDTPEGRDAIQRDLDRLETWTCVSLMKFSQAKCKVLHMSRDIHG